MRKQKFFLSVLVVVLLVVGAGCARRAGRVRLPNLTIPVNCASEITFFQCDIRVDPPMCKTARVKYRHGCEQVVVGKKK